MSRLPMAVDAVYPDVRIETEIDGAGNGWTDITNDVRFSEPVQLTYGIDGGGPQNRVGGSGDFSAVLDNSEGNEGSQLGWYSPIHPFARSGVALNAGVRIRLGFGGVHTYKKFYIDECQPTSGVNGERMTELVGVDWMNRAAGHKLQGIPIQLGKRSDEIFSAIYQDVTPLPANTSIATGAETFKYALDNARDESEQARSAFQKLANSELGFIFTRRDATDGETLVFQSRHSRPLDTTVQRHFDASEITGLDGAGHSNDQLFTRFQVVTHNRRVDPNPTTILYSLGDTVPEVPPGGTIHPFGPYRDPTQEAARVGGTDMVTPVLNTDYAINSLPNGMGADVAGDHTVVASFGANGVRWTITNNGSIAGHVTKLQARGRGIYDFARLILEAEVAGATVDRVLTFDMPYQDDGGLGQSIADHLRDLYGSAITVPGIEFVANRNADLMNAALTLDVGDRITISEEVTGVDASTHYHIHSVDFELVNGEILFVRYGLAPAIGLDVSDWWILGTSQLGIGTKLGL